VLYIEVKNKKTLKLTPKIWK